MLFKSYLKTKRKYICMFVLFGLIFLLIFYLYNYNLVAVLYPFLLCFVFGIIFTILDYNHFKKQHNILADTLHNIDTGDIKFPETSDIIESDYQDIINKLSYDKKLVVSKADEKQSDMVDYYTLWVHQIKTPISAMSMLLQTEGQPDKVQLRGELFKIERYVELVLQYLRLDSMSSDLKIQNYNLENIVRQAVKKYAPIFIGKKLSVEIGNIGVDVLTDEKWLVFVLEQIISNSLKYTSSGKISFYLASERFDDNSKFNINYDRIKGKVLVIEDTGIGINSEDLPRVFENGFTGYNGRMDKKASGMGLYLCKKVISNLNNEIWIESVEGKGTKVYINLNSYDKSVDF